MDIETSVQKESPTHSNIPIIDGSKDNLPPPDKADAYKKLMDQSDEIISMLDQSQIVEDGYGSADIPEDVAEMGDSVSSQVEFEGKVEDAPPQDDSHEAPREEIPLQDVEQQFNQNAQHYEGQAREEYFKQLEQERPYLLQRQHEMAAELEALKKQKQTFEDEELKNYENSIVEGIKDAHYLGEVEKQTILIRELAKIDRIKEDRKRERESYQQQPHPFYQQQVYQPQAYQQQAYQPQVYQPQAQQPPAWQIPQQPYQAPAQQPVAYQHPLTSHMPTQPSAGTPRTAAPSSSTTKTHKTPSSPSNIHPFARSLMESHRLPPGMNRADYEKFYLKINENIKDRS